MKIRYVLLACAALWLAPLPAAEPIGINALTSDPAKYESRVITVTGLVDRVSAARRMVVLIDATEATCTDACERKTLIVELPESAPIPAKGKTLTATGKLSAAGTPPRLVASEVVSEK